MLAIVLLWPRCDGRLDSRSYPSPSSSIAGDCGQTCGGVSHACRGTRSTQHESTRCPPTAPRSAECPRRSSDSPRLHDEPEIESAAAQRGLSRPHHRPLRRLPVPPPFPPLERREAAQLDKLYADRTMTPPPCAARLRVRAHPPPAPRRHHHHRHTSREVWATSCSSAVALECPSSGVPDAPAEPLPPPPPAALG